ncbi:unnamed protein product [Polarella glacialis]|uniref:Uncharacterized protein n=1 Tax=Polarella glacialis TaxID=89957 RepID=A0A813DIR3_POLGL|nr:unnamed protein product [Polarella glacialis]
MSNPGEQRPRHPFRPPPGLDPIGWAPSHDNEPLEDPLESLPGLTARALRRIVSRKIEPLFDGGAPDSPDLDVCLEISPDLVVQALRETCPPPITLTSFMDGSLPALTLFEICARVGSGSHLRELRRSAQRRLSALLFGGRANLKEVFRLARAGAEPLRQHLSSFSCLPDQDEESWVPAKKRARIEGPDCCLASLAIPMSEY